MVRVGKWAALAAIYGIMAAPSTAFAYPTEVKASLSLGFGSTVTGLAITDNHRNLFTSYSDVLKVTDLARWALAADQPPALSSKDGTEGNIQGIAYAPSNSSIYAVQDNGHLLTFNFNTITNIPVVRKLLSGVKLGPVAINTSSSPITLYIVDNASSKVYIWQAGSNSISGEVNLKQAPDLTNVATAFNITDILYVPATNEVYVATDIGIVAYFSVNNTGNPNDFVLDDTKAADIAALAVTPDGSKLYAAAGSQLPPSPDAYPTIWVVSTSTHQQVSPPMTLEESENASFASMKIMEVVEPTGAKYGFVSGTKGVTVFNTSNDTIIDVDTTNDQTTKTYDPIPTSDTSGPLIASGDNYLYLAGSGKLLVITDNPWVAISGITYRDSSGAETTALKQGGSAVVTFRSDTAGQYRMMAGGSIDRSGIDVVDTNGSSTGTVTAAADTAFTFNYNDNSGSFEEGSNTFFVFVTAEGNSNLKGRSAANVTVDTPPGAIEIKSTGFGNERAYITFGRLTANDMSHYNLYADTDPEAVRTKEGVSAVVLQTGGGSAVTGHIDGLTNDTTYYLAVEGVDNNSNVGPRAYLLSDGTAASAVPQETVGPAGMSGETGGCALIAEGKSKTGSQVILIFIPLIILVAAKFTLPIGRASSAATGRASSAATGRASSAATGRASSAATGRASSAATILIILLLGATAHAEEEYAPKESPQWWSMEIRSGFWMPSNGTTKKFFDKCCNIVTSVSGGLLYKGRYGAEAGVGFMVKDRPALGATTGERSSDTFNMFLLPMETTAVWRMDYAPKQIVVPYLKAGFDYVFYREGDRGGTIKGLKTGMHATGGLQFLFPWLDTDMEYGLNGMYFIMEARYGWINSFGKKGLDLSGPIYSAGLLFEF